MSPAREVCLHVKAAFDWIQEIKSYQYFLTLKDFSQEKAAFLKPYGLTLDDAETKDITFYLEQGVLKMRHPEWLWEVDATRDIQHFKTILSPGDKIERIKTKPDVIIDFEIGFLFNFKSDHFKNGFEFETVKVYQKESGPLLKKLSLHNDSTYALLKEVPDEVYETLFAMSDMELINDLGNISPGLYMGYSNPWTNLPDNYRGILRKHYFGKLLLLWPYLAKHKNVFQLSEDSLNLSDRMAVTLSSRPVELSFVVHEDEKFIVITLQSKIGERIFNEDEVSIHPSGIFMIDQKFHLPKSLDDLDVIDRFKFGRIKIPVANRAKVITEIIPLLEKKYAVEVPERYALKEINTPPVPQIFLKEYEKKHLLIQPQFRYEGATLDYEANCEDLIHQLADGTWQTVKRDRSFEHTFLEKLRLLHPFFERQYQNDFLYLPFAEVMKNTWFIKTIRQWQSEEITVLGMQHLKNFRYNPNPPKWEIKAGSDIDWFDLRIKLSFGSQDVPLKDVRRALITRQNIVLLGDGTMGLLPEEWLKNFSLIMTMGQEKDGNLRVSKLHFTLIDELHEQIDNEKILEEIHQKKQKLLTINEVKTVKVSKKIKATLRPYQQSGFQWLQVLDEMGWGGCLADDMGLGKTLQAISFLQFVKEKYTHSTSLVVCPTSLIYNWESELKKFAPSLRYHIYYGADREFSDEHFEDFDIIITSYGIVRNDLEHLLKFSWHYIVLDESQAIKIRMR